MPQPPGIDPITQLGRLALLAILLTVAYLLTACGGMNLPADPAKMTAEQIKALATDRSAAAACTTVAGPWGTGRTIFVQLDKGTIPAGAVTVSQDCQITITATEKKP